MTSATAKDLELRFPAAAALFGAYFHQDWDANASNSDEVVRDFASTQSVQTRRRAIKDIESLLVEFVSEDSLEQTLRLLASYYNPKRAEGSQRAWLERVVVILRYGATGNQSEP